MIRFLVRTLALALAILFVLVSCAEADEPETLPESFDYQIDMTEYESAVVSEGDEYLLLANKQHPLEEHYAPASISALPAELCNSKTVELESTAALAAEALVRELHARGYTHIVVTSGYRSYAYQRSLFYTYLDREAAAHPDWTTAQCEAEVSTYSARPGESEHQTGLCLDLINRHYGQLDETFANEQAYAFLKDNAHAFGFILRYPEGKETITGYTYEPWHYRFVGVKAATEIYEQGLTLEEYLAQN